MNLAIVGLLMLAAGSAGPAAAEQDAFFDAVAKLCGKAFAGRVISTDPADADMAAARLVMHVRDCSANEIRIPFQVDDNRSRTWVLRRTRAGLSLKHIHRHRDGTEDAVSRYGGETPGPGSAGRQSFPVDTESVATFRREGLTASLTNVWTMHVSPEHFGYELNRKGRHFHAEFDLSRPVPLPPAAWGDTR